jgi:hypothetical protein
LKEKHTGRLVSEWTAAISAPERASSFELIEVAPVLSLAMSVKDEDELVRILIDMGVSFLNLIFFFIPYSALYARRLIWHLLS